MTDIDNEWENYLKGIEIPISEQEIEDTPVGNRPTCTELYISTKTKVLFLNHPIDMDNVFWEIPVTEYWKSEECVIKKQMKIVSKTREEFQNYQERILKLKYYTEHIIKQIDNPNARRIKFKDERKITVGISKKDIMNCRSKQKGAFYNCFTMILRFRLDTENIFREIHVKVFNTGKLEIPGILNNDFLKKVKEMILFYLTPHVAPDLSYNDINQNVLINSNFSCRYNVDREKLMTILQKEYGIETSYDQSTYPGLKCKYYFHHEFEYDKEKQKGVILPEDRATKIDQLIESGKYSAISFMIFQTGSGLIVGKCDDIMLDFVYHFIRDILEKEYERIVDRFGNYGKDKNEKIKKTKPRKRIVFCNK
jgi:hypothetical protein